MDATSCGIVSEYSGSAVSAATCRHHAKSAADMGVTVFLPQPWGMLFASWSGRSLSHGPHRAPGAPLMRQVRLMRRAVTNHQGTALCCKDVCEAKLGMTPLA